MGGGGEGWSRRSPGSLTVGKALHAPLGPVDFPKTFGVRTSEHSGLSLRSFSPFSRQRGRQELAQEGRQRDNPGRGHPPHLQALFFRASFSCSWKNRGHTSSSKKELVRLKEGTRG